MFKNNSEELLTRIRTGVEMTRKEKINLIVQLSIPSILAQLSSILMFFIDAAMVGSLGAQQSASIGLIESTTWLFGGLTSAVSMGFSVQVAHFIGANDFEKARNVLRQSITCASIWGLILMCIGLAIHTRLPFWLGGGADIAHNSSMYFLVFSCALPLLQIEGLAGSMLKCAGNMKIPSILNIMMCVLDVIFNYIFIFQVGLGVLGAAIGTFLAMFCTAIGMLYFLLYRSNQLALVNYKGSFRPKEDVIRQAISIGAPMGFQQILMGGAQVVSTMIVTPLGNMAIAANSFAITVESICYMPGFGIAEAATTLVGQSIGAGKRMLTRSFAHLSVGLGICVMTFMGILMFIFAPEMIGIMTPVEEIRQLGVTSLRIEAFAEPLFAAAIVSNGVFVGAGNTLIPAIMNLGSIWIVRLSLAALLATKYGLPGVWTAMAIELIFRGIIFLIRLYSGKWSKKI